MKEYLDLVRRVLDEGVRKPSRTGVETISYFSAHYRVDLAAGFPLLTTKEMYWKSMLRELLWYLSGEEHIRNLREYTKIWDAWADADGNLDSAYGYFWRRYPSARQNPDGTWTVRPVDQIRWVIETLRREPTSRRLVVSAWDPGNAQTSRLPPCHFAFVFNVQEGRLNCHLTQRSGDVALGIPFNLACYAALTQIIAAQADLTPGFFSHTIVDAHIYAAPKGSAHEAYDHVEGLKIQLAREPRPLPRLVIAPKPIDDLRFEDFELVGYRPHGKILFKVAV
jgi:thymidylate synthase